MKIKNGILIEIKSKENNMGKLDANINSVFLC